MLKIVIAMLFTTGCLVETFTDGVAGVVYECRGLDGSELEFCALDGDDLARWLGDGVVCQPSKRWFPRFTNGINNGCVYRCPSPSSGCNAHNGCACF